MVKIRLMYDSDGYIDGWGTDYTDENVVEVKQEELDTLAIGATKLVDGHLVVDEDKLAEISKPNVPQPTPEQQMIAALMAKVAKLEDKDE